MILLIVSVLILGYLGFVPVISNLFGSNKPKDLGIKHTETDRNSARIKGQVEWVALTEGEGGGGGYQLAGRRAVKTEFSSAEISALMNNRPWKYWPYKDVQVKFNKDGSGEISGIFLKDRLVGYGAKIEAPKEAVVFAQKLLPTNTVFYLKGKAALKENEVILFEPEVFELGRLSLPVKMFLSRGLTKEVLAIEINQLTEDLAKIQNKKGLIVNYINQRLGQLNGFYAKEARAEEDKLIFEGSLPEREMTVR
jgi:hypothetical protein